MAVSSSSRAISALAQLVLSTVPQPFLKLKWMKVSHFKCDVHQKLTISTICNERSLIMYLITCMLCRGYI